MFPHFGSLLSHAPSARYMIVKSGTSRVVVLDGSEIWPGAAGRREMLGLMKGTDGNGGLAGTSFQENKIAVVWTEKDAPAFRFRFFQMLPETGQLLPMECSNSASSSAMFAQLGGHHRGRVDVWKAINLSTKQRVELRAEGGSQGIPEAWRVRFLASPKSRVALRGLTDPKSINIGRRTVWFHPVLLGNLFLFVDLDPDLCHEEISEAVAQRGMKTVSTAGFDRGPNYHPKVIPYRIAESGESITVRTASYYCGELHRSFPGSAAMALASYLERNRSDRTTAAQRTWQVVHPSGEMQVSLGFNGASPDGLRWAEFTTPVRLLAWGSAYMPWRAAA